MKSKGERERYIQLNAGFQRTARRDKKAFFNEQCVKLEGIHRRGKTRNLFRKIGAIKGIYCPKMGTIKDVNCRNLVDTEKIKKRWKEYTKELYKKDPNKPDCYDGVVSHPEPDSLEIKVKWALGSTAVNKASGCNGIPVELFKILKDDAIKVLYPISQHIWKTQPWPQDWKRSIFIPVPKKGSTKECASHQTITLLSHASKVMLKLSHARLQHYANQELPDVKTGFRKGRETRDQIANICWITDEAREFQKNTCLCFTDYTKAFDCVDHDKLWESC